MDNIENSGSIEEKALSRDLDECAFVYGKEFTKIVEPSRNIAKEFFGNATERDEAESADRTRVHIDLGENKSSKVSPVPESGNKSLDLNKKPKK